MHIELFNNTSMYQYINIKPTNNTKSFRCISWCSYNCCRKYRKSNRNRMPNHWWSPHTPPGTTQTTEMKCRTATTQLPTPIIHQSYIYRPSKTFATVSPGSNWQYKHTFALTQTHSNTHTAFLSKFVYVYITATDWHEYGWLFKYRLPSSMFEFVNSWINAEKCVVHWAKNWHLLFVFHYPLDTESKILSQLLNSLESYRAFLTDRRMDNFRIS